MPQQTNEKCLLGNSHVRLARICPLTYDVLSGLERQLVQKFEQGFKFIQSPVNVKCLYLPGVNFLAFVAWKIGQNASNEIRVSLPTLNCCSSLASSLSVGFEPKALKTSPTSSTRILLSPTRSYNMNTSRQSSLWISWLDIFISTMCKTYIAASCCALLLNTSRYAFRFCTVYIENYFINYSRIMKACAGC